MLFTPLRKALIGGAAIFAVGVAAGVGVHSATASNPTLTASTATPSPSPGASNTCKPAERGAAFGAARQVLAIAASVLGQTREQILDQLRSGKTLDQVAGSKASTIEQQSLDKLKSALDKRVTAGKLSSTQETTMLAAAKTALVKAMSSDLSGRIPAAGAGAGCTPDGLLGTLVKVTADQTGMTVQQVMDALRSGKSIDQIAGDKAAAIKAAVLQEIQQRDASALDTLMGRGGLPGGGPRAGAGPGRGFGGIFGGRGGGKPQATATPAA
jgi:hypothetical protein